MSPDEQAINKIVQFELGNNLPDESKWEEEEPSFPPPDMQAARRFTSWRFPISDKSCSPDPAPTPPNPVSRFTIDGGRVKVIDFAFEQTLPPVLTVPLPLPSPILRAPSFKRRREVSPGNPQAARDTTVKKSRPSQSDPIVVEHLGSSRRKNGPGHNRRAPKGTMTRRSSSSKSGGIGRGGGGSRGGSRDRLSSFSMTPSHSTPTHIHIPEHSSPDTEPDDGPMTPVTSTSICLLALLVSPKESREEELASHQFFGQQVDTDSGIEFTIPESVSGISFIPDNQPSIVADAVAHSAQDDDEVEPSAQSGVHMLVAST